MSKLIDLFGRAMITPGGVLAAVAWMLWAVTVPAQSSDRIGFVIVLAAITLIGSVTISTVIEFGAARFFVTPVPVRNFVLRIFMGALAGFTYAYVLDMNEIAVRTSLVAQILVPAVVAPLFLGVVDRLVEVRNSVFKERENLVQQATTFILTSESEREVISEIRLTITHAVDVELIPARDEITRRLALLSAVDGEAIPQGQINPLRDITENSLRPILENLAEQRIARPEKIGLLKTMWLIVSTQFFVPLPLALIYAFTNVMESVPNGNLTTTLEETAIGVLLIYLILGGANLVLHRTRLRHELVFISAFILLQTPTVWSLISNAVNTGEATAVVVTNVLASVFLSGVLVLVTSGFGSWKQRQVDAQQALRESLDQERIASLARARVAAHVARDVAHVIHGPVQSRVAACAVAMETASRAGDMQAYVQALHTAQQALASLPSHWIPSRSAEETTITDSVTKATDPWKEVISLQIHIEENAGSLASGSGRVEQIVEEAVTNAVRHGGADHVTIAISLVDRSVIQVVITDNGSGLVGLTAGIGSELLTKLTGGHWDRANNESGTGVKLTAFVASQPVRIDR